MTPLQIAALEQFLANTHFEYDGYNEEVGAVIYSFNVSDWTMEVAYGDECYYCLYNDVTEESICEEFATVSAVMNMYDKFFRLQLTQAQS